MRFGYSVLTYGIDLPSTTLLGSVFHYHSARICWKVLDLFRLFFRSVSNKLNRAVSSEISNGASYS